MECLARFHEASRSFPTDAADSSHDRWFHVRDDARSPAVTERLERLTRWMAQDCRRLRLSIAQSRPDEFSSLALEFAGHFERLAPRIADRLAAAAKKTFLVQPCLRDVWHDHVLFTGDDVTGLIDASACRSDHVAVDLSRLLGSLVGNDRRAWNFALDAYARHRKLSSDELDLVSLLDASGVLLSGMTWLNRRYLQGMTFPQPQRVLARLKHFLSRLRDNGTWSL
jgi:Ser/Thr protein kinase RdoA (MazF antagonist)